MPATNLLGERGRGFAGFLETLDEGRIAVAALRDGRGDRMPRTGDLLRGRPHGSCSPLGTRQHIAFMIAGMQARVHTAQLAGSMRRG